MESGDKHAALYALPGGHVEAFSLFRQFNVDTCGAPESAVSSATDEYSEMISRVRRFLNLAAGAKCDSPTVRKISEQLEEVAVLLEPFQVPELAQVFGRRNDLADRGQTLTPPFTITVLDKQVLTGTVEFGRYFLGRNAAVHGGAVSLLFDEVLGRLSTSGGRTRSRTAYLRVNYRNITPIEVQLNITARFVKEEGRKRFLTAELWHGDTLCADVEGLFIELKPGQP